MISEQYPEGMCTEYGKHLMERNHELQSHIHTLQEIIDEKNEEINMLEKLYNENKRALEIKLVHIEQMDYHNNELEKQLNYYRNSFEKEKLRLNDSDEAYTELSNRYSEIQNELRKLKNASQSFATPHTNNNFDEKHFQRARKKQTNRVLQKSSSDMKLNRIGEYKDFDELKSIFTKWSAIFDGFCKKRLNELRLNANKLIEENSKLNEDYALLNEKFHVLNKSHTLLLIDLEEVHSFNSKTEEQDTELTKYPYEYHRSYSIENDGEIYTSDVFQNFEYLTNEGLKKDVDTQYDRQDIILSMEENQATEAVISCYFRKIYDTINACKSA